MSQLVNLLHLACLVSCIATALTALLTRRLGPRSWLLPLFLVPAGLSGLALALGDFLHTWSEASAKNAALSLIVLAVPGAFLYSNSLRRSEDSRRRLAVRLLDALVAISAIVIGTMLFDLSLTEGVEDDLNQVHVRSTRYLAGLFLVSTAIIVLAALERVIRSAEDHVRWEIKFVVLGIGTPFVSLIYLGTSLLSRPGLHTGTLATMTLSLLPACGMIWIGWKRGTGRGGVRISQGLTYSTVTLVGVGIYLLGAGSMATWTTNLLGVGPNARVLVTVMLSTALIALLLTTRVRHRLRDWVRLHMFSGTYDYRAAWLEASRTIRANDPPELAGDALCAIVQRTVGCVDVSVWLCDSEGDSLDPFCARGPAADDLPHHIEGVAESLRDHVDPISYVPGRPAADTRLSMFFRQTGAVLLIPMRSADETLGLLAVGRNRSGREFDWYSREFLRALTRHAAGEFHKRKLLDVLVQAKEDEVFRTFSTFLLHDLKNYSSTLSMIAENAVRHADNPAFIEDAFTSIVDTARKMKHLCGSLRTFSTSAGQDRRSSDLTQLIDGTIDGMRHALAQDVIVRHGDLPTVRVDQDEIVKVLQNLVLNAAEASSSGADILLETTHGDGEVQITLHDQGCGISPEFLEDGLFMPFRTTKSTGLGIGLFQCRKIVEAHGGNISIASEKGKGTTVRVSLAVDSRDSTDRDRPDQVHAAVSHE